MSRALDPQTIAVLKSGDHLAVFNEIASIFTYPTTTTSSPPLFEIEILRGLGFDPSVNILRDENAMAVAKLRLVQAFFVARVALQKYIKILSSISELNVDEKKDNRISMETAEAIHGATAVCLLSDAENLTAANTRKRLISYLVVSSDLTVEQRSLLLAREKWLTDSLLTSRLHRHTKSPTLWNHRRWLLEEISRHGQNPRSQELIIDIPDEISRIITVAGERHPRNYYAWSHARWLVTKFPCDGYQLVEIVKRWTWKNYTDISGWSFLLFVMERQRDMAQGVVMETMRFAESLQWRNESVWWFLRTVMAGEVLGDAMEKTRARFNELGEKLFKGRDGDKKVWEMAMLWVERNTARPGGERR